MGLIREQIFSSTSVKIILKLSQRKKNANERTD